MVVGRTADRAAVPARAVISLSFSCRPRLVACLPFDGLGRARAGSARLRSAPPARWPSAAGSEDSGSVAPGRRSPPLERPAPELLLPSPAGVLVVNGASLQVRSAHSKLPPSHAYLGSF